MRPVLVRYDVKYWNSRCDVAAISSFTAQIKEAYALADRLRSRGTRVILGGLHVTALPDEAAQHADSIVIGEGEPVWQTVMRDLLENRLEQRYDARGMPFDLGLAPMPRFELLDPDRYNRLTVQTARLPVQLRVLCCLDPLVADLPVQAGGEGHRRDQAHQADLGEAVHRVRG